MNSTFGCLARRASGAKRNRAKNFMISNSVNFGF
jgi:hypothetical protein